MVRAAVGLLFCGIVLHAEVTTGTLSGHIWDATGRPIPGAMVSAVNPAAASTRSVLSDAAGIYRLSDLPVARYDVRAEAPGFSALKVPGIAIAVNARLRLDFRLQVAPVRESVEVTASAPSVAVSESSDLAVNLERSRITRLPLNRRDFLQLALLVAGVLPPVEDSELSSRGSFAMHAAGAREEFNNFLLDGADNNDPYTNRYVLQPPVDSIQEFKVEVSGYSAEYGRSGGGQVNVVTRAGSNPWHGSLYEYLRNRALDARNFFDLSGKPQYIRNQSGGELGGAFVKNRSFVFANLDGLRERRGLTRLAAVPEPVRRTGDLSDVGQAVIDPFTGRPFAGNRIPQSRLSPVGLKVLGLFPAPNRPGPTANYLAQPVGREADTQAIARFDQRFSDTGQTTLRYGYMLQDALEPFAEESTDIPGFGDVIRNIGHNALVHHEHVFSAHVLSSTRLAFTRSFRQALPQNHSLDVNRLWDVDWLRVRRRDLGFPAINIAGFPQVGDVVQLPLARHANTYQAEETLSLDRGAHGLKAGAEFRRVQLNGFLDYYARGSLTFPGALTGSGLGDVLLGLPSFGIQSQFDNPQALRTTAYSGFVQDDWKAALNLTLTLGIRYEYATPPVDAHDRGSFLDLGTRRLANVATNGISRSGLRADWNNFAPRVGFAWSPMPRLALRGAYGLYYDGGMLVVNSALYFNPPYFTIRAFFPTQQSLLTLNNPFPTNGGIVPPPSPSTLSPDLTTAYVQHWNLALDREFGATTFTAAYAGSRGTHLIRSLDLNQPRPAPGPVQARRPDPKFGGIFFTESGANSEFHSLQLSANRRYASGLSALVSYTFSKSIDYASAYLGTKADKNFPQDSHNYAAERGLSSFDAPHRLAATAAYAIPGRTRWRRGWELQAIAAVNSGQPFTPILRFDNSNTGNSGGIFGSDRPDVLRDPALTNRTPEQWFDPTAFRVAERYRFGNAGRNIVRGPGLATFDVGLAREFSISDRARLAFHAQAFNALNRANFDLPERLADEPATFGRILSAKSPRQVQFAIRLAF